MNNLDKYITFHTHQRGNDHISLGRGCEDYSLAGRTEKCVYAIVCDGHGGSTHFRSQLGSKFCAEAIKENLEVFAEQVNAEDFKKSPGKILERLVDSIMYVWIQKVDEHFEKTALPDKDEPRWNSVSNEDKKAFREAKNSNGDENKGLSKYFAYGTTFKFACVLNGFWFCAQLGDGTTCYYRNKKFQVADSLISDTLKEWKANRATEHMTTSTCTYYQTKAHNVCYDWGTSDDETPRVFLCLTDGVDGAKAMSLMSDDVCKDDEIPSEYLKDKSALYFQFVRNHILEVIEDEGNAYAKNKTFSKEKLEEELNNALQEEIKTMCDSDFHYHDDIGIAGIIKKGDLT